jgi:hypothetical protein
MNWRFSPDVQVPFSVILDKGRREFFGISRVATTNNNIIQAIVTADEGDNWLDDFTSSETMTVKFHRGNEPQWPVKMAGSRDASKAFPSCVKTLPENGAPAPQATSPVPDVPESQPAPTSPVPTMPIKKPKGEHM